MIKINKNFRIIVEDRFRSIYEYFDKGNLLSPSELFAISAIIGYKNKYLKSLPFRSHDSRSFQINSTSFKKDSLTLLTSIILERHSIPSNLSDNDIIFKYKNELEDYANGGMEIICDKVFSGNWDGISLSSGYNEILEDLLYYLLDNAKGSELTK